MEQFADLQILRYKVEFETLTLKQKELVYYLTQAALEGRDILFDQNGKYNLRIRRMLEAVYTNYKGDKSARLQKYGSVPQTGMVLQWYSSSLRHGKVCARFLAGLLETGSARNGRPITSVIRRTDCRTTL